MLAAHTALWWPGTHPSLTADRAQHFTLWPEDAGVTIETAIPVSHAGRKLQTGTE